MKRWSLPIIAFVAVLGLAGTVVTLTGTVPIKASSGHWGITEWFLRFSKSRSVSTYSTGIAVPDNLDTDSRVMKGAGHFETGCASCHGSPIWKQPRIAQRLTPTPPHLPEKVPDRTDGELFYLVKHGIKFTGMPAFPSSQRDDEVWDMVAFLRRLPELDEPGYRELVFGADFNPSRSSTDAPLAVVAVCSRCHGLDGSGRSTSAFPKLSGLHKNYFVATMQAYAEGKRHSGMMEPVAARLTDEQIEQIANHYAGHGQQSSGAEQPASNATSGADSSVDSSSDSSTNESLERGRQIAESGLPDQDVGACIACHPTSRSDQNPDYPFLGGQPADYLVLQIKLFQQRRRGGTASASLMHSIVNKLEAEDIRDVARYYASLGR